MGALTFIWKLQAVELRTKCLLYKAIPLNLLLWGAENWSQNSNDIKKLERFHHNAIRRILGVSMTQVKEERITNAEIRKRFENIPPIRLIIAKKQLKWLGKIVRMEPKQIPTKILTCFFPNPRCSGRRFRTTRDGIHSNLCLLYPNLPTTGNLAKWRKYAFYEGFWEQCLNALMDQSEMPVFNESEWTTGGQNDRNRTSHNRSRNNNSGANTSGDGNEGSSAPRNSENNTRNNHAGFNSTSSPNLNMPSSIPDPSFFTHMSHIHTTQTACRCLGVQSNYTTRTLTLQYKRMARHYHPDKWHQNTGCSREDSTRIFQCISSAYTLLRNSRNNG